MTTSTQHHNSSTLLDLMRRECPQAIKGTMILPTGLALPIIGTVSDDGTSDIDPAFWDLLQRAGRT